MTDEQRRQIRQLRSDGCGYTTIAKKLAISRNTIRSFCRRNGLAGRPVDANEPPAGNFCRQCQKELRQTPGQKRKIFCCRQCREEWWHAHPDRIRQRAIYTFICAGCKKPFTAYGNAHRKYCSHECYIKTRFKGGAAHE